MEVLTTRLFGLNKKTKVNCFTKSLSQRKSIYPILLVILTVSEDGCIEIYPTGEIYTEQTLDSYLAEKYRQAGMYLCLT